MRPVLTLLLVAFASGCTTTARVTNTPVATTMAIDRTAISSRRDNADNALFFISFSGGGTRAAALSYGVLEALREGAARGTIRRDIETEVLLVPVMGTIHALIGAQGARKLSTGRAGNARDPGPVLAALVKLIEPTNTND